MRTLAARLCPVVVAVMATIRCASLATAQDGPSPTELAAARELFGDGVRAAREERWVDAREAFARSFALAPLPGTRLNLAGAQVQSGQLVDGAESYRRFLSEATGRSARFREEAERALAEVEARIPSVRIEIDGLAPRDTLRLDGRSLSRAAVGVRLPLDPGEHLLEVVRPSARPVVERFSLSEREERAIRVDARPVRRAAASPRPRRGVLDVAPSPAREPDDDRDEDRSGSVWSSPWLWIGVGAVVAGGVVTAVVLGTSGDAERFRGNLGPGVVSFE